MLSLGELQARKIHTKRSWVDAHKLVIIAGLKGVTSHLLYNLLFRLENAENGATVVLYDDPNGGELVTEEDVRTGFYTSQDVGKTCMDVLIERYTGVFNVSLVAGSSSLLTQMETGMNIESGVFFLDLTDQGYRLLQVAFEGVLNSRKAQENGFQNPLVYLRAVTKNDRSTIHARLVTDRGVLVGDPFQYEEESEDVGAINANGMRNQAVSMMLFNYINALISDGMFVEYHQLHGDFLKGEDEITRVFVEPPVFTVFDEYNVNADDLRRSTLKEFRDTWGVRKQEVLSEVYEPFISQFTRYGDRKYQMAVKYLVKASDLVSFGLDVMARNTVKRAFARKLRCLLDVFEEKGNDLIYLYYDEDVFKGYLVDYLTLIQYIKAKGLWFI